MAYALPSVSFDLAETRVSGGDSAVYVPSGDIGAFADAVESLLDNPHSRADLGRAARMRVSRQLDWQHQAQAYIRVFDTVLGREQTAARADAWPFNNAGFASDNAHIDLDDEAAYESFLLTRGRRLAVTDSSDFIETPTRA